jgi:hypothetical protein
VSSTSRPSRSSRPRRPEVPAISGNSTVIGILLKFADTTTEPFTVAQVQDKMFGAQGTSAYYAEASYGQHTLSGVVTQWLTATIDTPTTCDYISVANEAVARAQAAGYNPNSYQKQVYIFPHIPCGWSGLGGGSTAWINQSLSVLVIGHELGHCFGLGHSSSLDCGATVLGGSCTVSEYGDRFSIMGNSGARHFSAHYKWQLGYFRRAASRRTRAARPSTRSTPPRPREAASTPCRSPLPTRSTRTGSSTARPIGFDAGISGQPDHGRADARGARLPGVLMLVVPCSNDAGHGRLGRRGARRRADVHGRVRRAARHAALSDASGLVVQVELDPRRRSRWTGTPRRATSIRTACSRTARSRRSSRRT